MPAEVDRRTSALLKALELGGQPQVQDELRRLGEVTKDVAAATAHLLELREVQRGLVVSLHSRGVQKVAIAETGSLTRPTVDKWIKRTSAIT